MTNDTTAPERVWIESQAEETAEGYGSWDCRNVYDYDLEYVPATALEAAQARIAELEAQRQFLWDLLDDIDTLDDACKEHDDTFRKMARKKQQERWNISASDGYSVTFHTALEGKG